MKRLTLIFVLLAGGAMAAPDASLRPVLRPGTVVVPSQPISADETKPRGLMASLRPLFRSREAERTARQQRRLLRKGAVCGDIAIQGKPVGRVPGSLPGCGVENAVRITSVAGIELSTGAVMDCGTAQALNSWMQSSAKPAFSKIGGGLDGVKVAAHYVCRTRNHRKGAKISEHGKGRAIDISEFFLRDGSKVSVLKGWNAPQTRKAMRQVHKGACGPFGTVLGPNADRWHRDHFHFDTARYRSGSYCK